MDIAYQMEICNQTASSLLAGLCNEGVINIEQYRVAKQYSIVISKRRMLGIWWDKLWNKTPGSYKIMIVKVLNSIDNDDDDNDDDGDDENPKFGNPVKSGDFKPSSLN